MRDHSSCTVTLSIIWPAVPTPFNEWCVCVCVYVAGVYGLLKGEKEGGRGEVQEIPFLSSITNITIITIIIIIIIIIFLFKIP